MHKKRGTRKWVCVRENSIGILKRMEKNTNISNIYKEEQKRTRRRKKYSLQDSTTGQETKSQTIIIETMLKIFEKRQQTRRSYGYCEKETNTHEWRRERGSERERDRKEKIILLRRKQDVKSNKKSNQARVINIW